MIRGKESQPSPEELQQLAKQSTIFNTAMFVASVALIRASKSPLSIYILTRHEKCTRAKNVLCSAIYSEVCWWRFNMRRVQS